MWTLGLVLGLFGAMPSAKADSVRVICSVQAAWCDKMASAFKASTGVPVDMLRKSSGEALALLQSERGKPTVDVWWGGTGDPQLEAAEEGLTQSYKSPLTSELNGFAQRFAWVAGYRSVGIYSGTLGFSYNTNLLASKGLPAPACWADLLNPQYKGLIQVADPRRSGTAYTFLATLVQLKGEVGALAYAKQLHPNVATYTSSGSAPAKAVASGETLIGITFMHDAVALASAGAPVTVVSPCEGTGYEIGAMSLVMGAPNVVGAKRFFDFALSAAAQELAAEVDSFQLQSNRAVPLPSKAPNLSDTKLINYDVPRYGSAAVRKHLLSRWQQVLDMPPLAK
jgi:iron(III) transport system substrate-binding protein